MLFQFPMLICKTDWSLLYKASSMKKEQKLSDEAHTYQKHRPTATATR
jgi:hypothetical protein